MLNRSGITSTSYGNVTQILANVELQSSCGCVVDDGVGVTVGSKKIAKAGSPIYVDFSDLSTVAVAPHTAVTESATASIGDSTGITAATVTAATFGEKVDEVSGTYTFRAVVNSGITTWKFGNNDGNISLATYGVTATGTAANGDTITVVYTAASDAVSANAVLLHDVDVTAGDANGTALYFGVVNYNRLAADVKEKVSVGVNAVGAVTIIAM